MNKVKVKRVRMPNIIVSQSTILHLHAWRSYYGLPYGRIVDSLMIAAIKDPSFELSSSGRRKSLVCNLQQKPHQNPEQKQIANE